MKKEKAKEKCVKHEVSTSFKIKLDLSAEDRALLERLSKTYTEVLARGVAMYASDPTNKDYKPVYALAKGAGLSSGPACVLKLEVCAIISRYLKTQKRYAKRAADETEKAAKAKAASRHYKVKHPRIVGYPVMDVAKLRYGLYPDYDIIQNERGHCISISDGKRGKFVFRLVESEFHAPIVDFLKTLPKRKKPTGSLLLIDGEWYYKGSQNYDKTAPAVFQNPLGIDLGLAKVAVGYSPHNHKFDSFEKVVKQEFRYLKEHYFKLTKIYQRHGRNDKVELMKKKGSKLMMTANHVISKAIVEFALKNGNDAIIFEDLSGIRIKHEGKAKGERGRKWHRRLHGWAFYQLQTFTEYKAKKVGLAVIYVKPWKTSQACSRCGHAEKDNRLGQAGFLCKKCGFNWNADLNAAKNIANRGLEYQAFKQNGFKAPEKNAA